MTRTQQQSTEPVRRPRNRKELIVLAGAQLFAERGYHDVSLADVAAAVGITAPALYRHFRNKQDLLLYAVRHGLETLDSWVGDAADLDELIITMTAFLVSPSRRPGFTALWQRELRHLPDAERRALRRQLSGIAARIATLVRAERPELPAADADLLSWALLAVFASVSVHRLTLSRQDAENLTQALGFGVVRCPLPVPAATNASPRSQPARAASVTLPRREQLLTEAARLFAEQGFHSVNMNDIGAAVGIAGPSIYKHFPAKSDILVAAMRRGYERIQAGLTTALAQAATPQDALAELVRADITFAIENTPLVGLLISERDQLPDQDRIASRRAQRDILDVWLQTVLKARPGLDPARAKVTIQAVFALINHTVRTSHLAARPDFADRLFDLAMAVFAAA
ncbi:MAG TPA: TetR/AcrR family transcriptional regulator [Jatrophihabitans sp.]|nr:TetR/AcrR family transcriptional regulator [Jatrophihabitans sp.]